MQSLFVLIDIDNTLYEYSETGFGDEMHDRIFAFAREKVGLSTAEAQQLSKRYWLNYGLSLYGYVKEHNVNAKEYSDYVHQCSYDKLHYNKPLVDMLLSMQYAPPAATTTTAQQQQQAEEDGEPCPSGVDHLYYFTNANRSHARNVLEPQGLRPIFTRRRHAGSPVKEHHRLDDEAGFDEQVEWLGFSYEDQWRLTAPDTANKPMRRAYEAVFQAIADQVAEDATLVVNPAADATTASAAGGALDATEVACKQAHLHPSNFVMVDDSLMNLDAPLELGWGAVWYAHDAQELPADTADNASAALYAAAAATGQLQVIRRILDLRSAVERFREANAKRVAGAGAGAAAAR